MTASLPSESELAALAAEQRVEWVDADGTVLDIVTRSDMRARGLRHRSVYVVVLSPGREILLHRRAGWKDVFPSAWDVAFGGVCDPGESWIESARRELSEEAGVLLGAEDFVDLGPVAWEAPGVALIGQVFAVTTEGPFAFNDGEVTATEWVALSGLTEHLAALEIPTDSRDVVVPLLSEAARKIDGHKDSNE